MAWIRPTLRRLARTLPGLALVGSAAWLAGAQRVDPAQAAEVRRIEVEAAEVKAAYLLNFLRYTDWPPASFADDASPLRVAILDDDQVADALEAIVQRSASVRGRGVEVQRFTAAGLVGKPAAMAELREAHLVFFGRRVRDRAARLLAELEGSDVLTVGDLPRFAETGGMIGLRRDGQRIVFDANPAAIRPTKLIVSARVLKLARLVGSAEAPS